MGFTYIKVKYKGTIATLSTPVSVPVSHRSQQFATKTPSQCRLPGHPFRQMVAIVLRNTYQLLQIRYSAALQRETILFSAVPLIPKSASCVPNSTVDLQYSAYCLQRKYVSSSYCCWCATSLSWCLFAKSLFYLDLPPLRISYRHTTLDIPKPFVHLPHNHHLRRMSPQHLYRRLETYLGYR